MASPNISEIMTTTLFHSAGECADGVTKNIALLTRLDSKGRIRKLSGGYNIREEIEYQENGR